MQVMVLIMISDDTECGKNLSCRDENLYEMVLGIKSFDVLQKNDTKLLPLFLFNVLFPKGQRGLPGEQGFKGLPGLPVRLQGSSSVISVFFLE